MYIARARYSDTNEFRKNVESIKEGMRWCDEKHPDAHFLEVCTGVQPNHPGTGTCLVYKNATTRGEWQHC